MIDSTQSSTNTEKVWTDSEVQTLVEELKIEKNKAIDRAVQEATVPLLAEIHILKIERDFYKNRNAGVYLSKPVLIFGSIGLTALSFFSGYGVAHLK